MLKRILCRPIFGWVIILMRFRYVGMPVKNSKQKYKFNNEKINYGLKIGMNRIKYTRLFMTFIAFHIKCVYYSQ